MASILNSFFRKLRIGDFGKVLIRFSSAQIVTNFLGMLAGFLVVRILEPSLYGQFTGVGVYMGYILLGHFGILNGLNRELPYELGRKNDDYAKKLASSSFVLTSLLCGIAALVFLVFSLIHFSRGETLTGFIYLSYVLIGGLYLFNKQFLTSLYRTNNDFDSLAKQNVYVGIGNLVSVVLVYLFHMYGLLLRGVFLALLEFYLLMKHKPYQLSFKYKIDHLKKLFRTGFPIFLVGQVNSIWVTVMNTLIFNIGGALNFGLYALCNIIQGMMGVIPASFGQVIYPRMSIMLGEGKSVRYILKTNIKPLFFQFGLMLSVAIIGALLIQPVISWLLPKYINGVEAARWMLFVPAAQSFGALNNIYNVIKKQTWYFVSLVTGALVGSVYVYLTYRVRGFELAIFPKGLLLGTIVQQVMSLLFLRTLKNDD
ncbi:MAG: oligosaccharide flippase family protein [Bacteroidota bacterium]|nr:oligosaccharide flippase family protein [Bacteroidota bacterium]